ncbi:hypothetical protein Tco_1208047 [Tanacetum coccineum]
MVVTGVVMVGLVIVGGDGRGNGGDGTCSGGEGIWGSEDDSGDGGGDEGSAAATVAMSASVAVDIGV